jgi:signal transduction histidine kinase
MGHDEARSRYLVASARVLVASCALLMVWTQPTEPAVFGARVQSLLAVYTVFATVVLMITRVRAAVSAGPRFMMLTCDLSFGIVVTLMTSGPMSPLFPFLMFPIVSVAYSSGWQATLITTAVVVAALGLEAVLVGAANPLSIGVLEGDVNLSQVVIRLMYLVIGGAVLAALAEKEQRRRDEASTIGAIMEQASSAGEGRLDGTLETALGVVLRVFTADRAVLVMKQVSTGRLFLWDVTPGLGSQAAVVTSSELDDEQSEWYFFEVPGTSWHALRIRTTEWFDLLALDPQGGRLPTGAFTLPPALLAAYRCQSALGMSIAFGEEWVGRVLLFNPQIKADREAALHLADRLARQIGPAAHQSFLLGTLRATAASAERARLARELHDDVVQSLIAAEIQVEVVRRRSETDAPQLTGALTGLRSLLRAETRKLRDLTQRLKAPQASARPSVGLTDMVARFERDTGIQARFFSGAAADSMSPRSSHEIAQILQEALVNVQKHSGARHVLVRAAAASHGRLKLSIEDDGCGFPFSGRLSEAELHALGQGPAVILERVRELSGEISVESRPGHGACVEVVVPLDR